MQVYFTKMQYIVKMQNIINYERVKEIGETSLIAYKQ